MSQQDYKYGDAKDGAPTDLWGPNNKPVPIKAQALITFDPVNKVCSVIYRGDHANDPRTITFFPPPEVIAQLFDTILDVIPKVTPEENIFWQKGADFLPNGTEGVTFLSVVDDKEELPDYQCECEDNTALLLETDSMTQAERDAAMRVVNEFLKRNLKTTN